MVPCQQDRVFEMMAESNKEIKEELKEIRKEIKDLNNFKIKVTAFATIISAGISWFFK